MSVESLIVSLRKSAAAIEAEMESMRLDMVMLRNALHELQCRAQPDAQTESPDDWVLITDPQHVLRECDQISDYGTQWYPPSDLTGACGKPFGSCGFRLGRFRRKDHQDYQAGAAVDR